MSGGSLLQLGSVPLPLWPLFAVLAVIRQVLNLNKLKRNGRSTMNKLINIVSFALTGLAEMVWDIGTKVAAAPYC